MLEALDAGPVVITAPTGSGKSTRVPSWCTVRGRVCVVEPRRVAARGIATTVARWGGGRPGVDVGWVVRDDHQMRPDTPLVYVTPGIALRWLADGTLDRFATVVLDELHERTLDVDLLLALLRASGRAGLVAMSATLDGERVAAWLGGRHLHAPGRTFPVTTSWWPSGPAVPDGKGVEGRAIAAVRSLGPDDGDALVFMPGRREIEAVVAGLSGFDGDVLALHGGLPLAEQARVLRKGSRRRIVVATNVAETSLTVPGVRVVIDSGLARRTHYHHGRVYLALTAIAADSADQRAGRAGRTAPGRCIRLWKEPGRLDARTPPEVLRESLVPLALASAVCGRPLRELELLDAPQPWALDDAMGDLVALGAFDADEALTDRGRRLFGLPVDAHLGALLVAAEASGGLSDALDLVAALSARRPLFVRRVDEEDDLGDGKCDALALVRAVRVGDPGRHGVDREALRAARRLREQLGEAFYHPPGGGAVDRRRLAADMLAAWPRCALVKRRRGHRVAWSHGGTEHNLGRSCRPDPETTEAVLSLAVRAVGGAPRERELIVTAAMPVPLSWLAAAGRGTLRVAAASVERRVVVARLERVYAGKVLEVVTEPARGAPLGDAVVTLVLRGSLHRSSAMEARRRWARRALAARLGLIDEPLPGDDAEAWLAARIRGLGLEEPEDLALIEGEDLVPEEVPWDVAEVLDKEFPPTLDLGQATFAVRYEPSRRTVVLERKRGAKGVVPPVRYLPAWRGWRVELKEASNVRQLRGRR